MNKYFKKGIKILVILLLLTSIFIEISTARIVSPKERRISDNQESKKGRLYKEWMQDNLEQTLANARHDGGKGWYKTIRLQDTENEVQVIREEKECLHGHNYVRSLHDDINLQWDDDLAFEAEQWAIHMAIVDKGPMHSSFTDSKGNKYGENIYWWGGSDIKHCHNAIYLWYKEISEYDFQHPSNIELTGHFIQLVWDDTVKVGVGIAYVNQQTYIVARYYPAESGSISSHVHKPAQGVRIPSESELIPPNNPEPSVFTVQIKELGGTKPCADQSSNCDYWAKNSYCSDPAYDVKETCPVSCGICQQSPPVNGGYTDWTKSSKCSTTCGVGIYTMNRYCVEPYPINGGKSCTGPYTKTVSCNAEPCNLKCQNKQKDCGAYKELGYCTDSKYRTWMGVNCEESCNLCESGSHQSNECMNKHKDCEAYKELGYCTDREYRTWMKVNCEASCDVCKNGSHHPEECMNKDKDCEAYATQYNYCNNEKYSEFMKTSCSKACRFC